MDSLRTTFFNCVLVRIAVIGTTCRMLDCLQTMIYREKLFFVVLFVGNELITWFIEDE